MKRQKPKIGTPLAVAVYWYDRVPEPERRQTYQGEIIGWRKTQIIVRVKEYAILRFYKSSGLEVANRDYDRRGFRIDLTELAESLRPAPGVQIQLSPEEEKDENKDLIVSANNRLC